MPRLKPYVLATRVTERQYRKVEALAVNNGLTRSEVVSVWLDTLPEDQDLFSPIGNGVAVDFDPQRDAVSA